MSGATTSSKKPRILVVEDDAELLRMLSKILAPTAEVFVAGDGQDALALMRRGNVPLDLVITDLMMPRMDGLALAREMKQDPKFANIPVIMLTAKTTPRDVIAGINAGARHYLTKPFKAEELLAKVKKTLGR